MHSMLYSYYYNIVCIILMCVFIFSFCSGHGFIHKWLLLINSKDPSSGVKGYLKVSINVIGPGDIPIPSPSVMTPETVDVEE